ncbi:MAG: flippase-like domain-containing protein [Alphaproteobacteria bacterium]|nr:flippase-like domain-containing protein [Alphaproteobacteria bacterium]
MARRLPRRAWIGVALSLALSIWFIRTGRWDVVYAELVGARVSYVALASAMLVGEFVLRAMRWKVLLRPVDPEATVVDLFSATVIGAAANTLLPARAGEVAKPLVASRRTHASLPALIATNVMERVYDIFGLVSVLTATMLLMPKSPADSSEDALLVYKLKLYGLIAGAGALVAMAVFFWLASRGAPARAVFARIVSIAPPPVAERFMHLFDGFVEGLGATRDRRGMWQAGVLSLAIWFNGAAAIYVLFQAFRLTLPPAAACFTGVAIAVAVVFPQAPGFFGVFHFAIEKTLVLWDVPVDPAKAFAVVFWGVSFLPVTAVGLLALWREGLSLGGLWSRDREEPGSAGAAEESLRES